jgi:hypothetical protein
MGGIAATEPHGQAATGDASADKSVHPNGGDYNNSSGDEYVFTIDERNAMRAFLARCEVRLSTMHRVAVGFLSGAGLLFLFPVFLKDGVLTLMTALLSYMSLLPSSVGHAGVPSMVVILLCLAYPFLVSLGLPVLALLLLLKDIVRFYFVGHPPGFSEEFFNPRFVLTGIAFSPDESEEVKQRVLRQEYGSDLIGFVVSRVDAHSRYYSNIIDKPKRQIVPPTRKLPRLLKMGVVKLGQEKPLDDLADNDKVLVYPANASVNTPVNGDSIHSNGNSHSNGIEKGAGMPFVERTVDQIDHFNAALGLTGFVERSLYEEVAKTEVSVVRHSLKLRRLVLRYFQALLILIWTSFVTFLMLPFLQDASGLFSVPIVFSLTYLIWGALAPMIVQMPLDWLVGHPHNDVRRDAIKRFQEMDALQTFGKLAQWLCYGAVVASLVALVLEVALNI